MVCLKGRAGMWLALPGLGVYLSHVRALPDNIGSQRTWILVLPLPSALLSEANSILGPDSNFTIWYKKHRPYLYLLFVLCKQFVNQCFELSIHSFIHSFIKQAFIECSGTNHNSNHQPHCGQTKYFCFISDPDTKTWNFSMTDYSALSKWCVITPHPGNTATESSSGVVDVV